VKNKDRGKSGISQHGNRSELYQLIRARSVGAFQGQRCGYLLPPVNTRAAKGQTIDPDTGIQIVENNIGPVAFQGDGISGRIGAEDRTTAAVIYDDVVVGSSVIAADRGAGTLLQGPGDLIHRQLNRSLNGQAFIVIGGGAGPGGEKRIKKKTQDGDNNHHNHQFHQGKTALGFTSTF
jgi:hypothetical protein